MPHTNSLFSRTAPRAGCAGSMPRREWLRLGGLSLGALAAAASPSLHTLAAAEDSGGGKANREFSVILFWANGGPSQIDLFDLKPQAPADYRGPFSPIRTNVPGLEINELLPKLSQLADKFVLLRS